MAADDFGKKIGLDVQFIVQNTNSRKKTIKVCGIRIPYGTSYNLMKIGGIDQAYIINSFQKGEIKNKVLVGDITVLVNDLNLTTFNDSHATLLSSAGVTTGITGNTGGTIVSVANVTSTYSVKASDAFISCDATSGSFTVTLPDATKTAGQNFCINKINASNTVTIKPQTGQTINGASSITLTSQYSVYRLQSNGKQFYQC